MPAPLVLPAPSPPAPSTTQGSTFTGYVSPTNQNNYRNIVVTLTTRLPIAFGWLVGDAEWAMGIVRGAHGAEWGDFFHRGGAMTPGATERLMAAYLSGGGYPLHAASNR